MQFLFGLILGDVLTHILARQQILILILLSTVFAVFRYRVRFIVGFILAYLGVMASAYWHQQQLLPSHLEGKRVHIAGELRAVHQMNQQQFKITLFIQHTSYADIALTGIALLTGYGHYKDELTVGAYCRLTAKLKRPVAIMNALGMDREKSYFVNQLVARGWFHAHTLSCDDGKIARKNRFFNTLYRHVTEHIAPYQHRAIMKALLLGNGVDISAKTRAIYQQTGTAHLLVISGLHISLIANTAYRLSAFAFNRAPVIFSYLSRQQLCAYCALVAALFYTVINNQSIPNVRADLMLINKHVNQIMKTNLHPLGLLIVTVVCTLLLFRHAALQVSFWLSFVASFFLIYLSYGRPWRWFDLVRVPCAVALIMAVLSAYYFYQVSLISPLANLLAIPITSWLIVPLVLFGFIISLVSGQCAIPLFSLANRTIDFQEQILAQLAHLPYAYIRTGIQNDCLFFIGLFACCILSAPRHLPGKYCSIVLLTLVFTYRQPAPYWGSIIFEFFDVGQGLAVLIRTKNHVLLYDTGPSYSGIYTAAERTILPYSFKNHIQKIDKLIVSHFDNDHNGGTHTVQKLIPIDVIIAPEKMHKLRVDELCIADKTWVWDGIRFQVLYPTQHTETRRGKNNRSCVLRIIHQHHQVLLSGDIERFAENKLLNSRKKQLASTVLVAPHHGSKTSSSPEFVRAVHPAYVIFASGYRNRYRFPHRSIVSRYLKTDAKLITTGYSGRVSLLIDTQGGLHWKKHRDKKYIWLTPIKH